MSVILETNHGIFRLQGAEGETAEGILRRNGIPPSAVWTYLVVEDPSGPPHTLPGRRAQFTPMRTALSDFDQVDLHARASRNINLPSLAGFNKHFVRTTDEPSSEWVFPDAFEGAFQRVHTEMTADECLEFVRLSVAETLAAWPETCQKKIVVGTSGGGDSNVLLSTLQKTAFFAPEDLVPVMMLGIPDWDAGLENALKLCSSLGMQLEVIEEPTAAKLAGVSSISTCRDNFRDTYPDADLEFLGTWLLRKVLGNYAKAQHIDVVATGANREDLLAEGLARIARGRLPLPAPYRKIGAVQFVYPMYKVPKKIGDGAYPTLSYANYEARNPSFSRGRSVAYYLAYWIPDLAPGFDLDLVEGMNTLAALSHAFSFVEEIDDYVLAGSYSQDQLNTWAEFLRRNKA